MRGVVFTELIEFVEEALGFDLADRMLENAHLENGGVFSQGGNYPFDELVKIVVSLSKETGKNVDELLHIFGKHFFGRLVKLYGRDIREDSNSLDFIGKVEKMVHVEVRKLYPDADLPTFEVVKQDANFLVMHYYSEKRLESLALGLMEGCAEYFNEKLKIEYHVASEKPHKVEFFIEKV
jgi:hypothetical protein